MIAVQVLRAFVRGSDAFPPEKYTTEEAVVPITLTVLGLSRPSASWDRDAVPRIIHQTAPADESLWHHTWKPCQLSWFDNFKGFEYKMWTDEDIDNLIKRRFPNFLPIWNAYPRNIQRVDVIRYFILYEYGGIYVDMDFECVRDFYDLLPAGKVSIAKSAVPGEEFQNALMASPPRHPFWHYVFNEVIPYQHVDDVLASTGPDVIRRVAEVVPGTMLYPLPDDRFSVQGEPQRFIGMEFKRSMRDDIYAIHHGSCTHCG
jgi:mannosyltransferase OCH1-like enzyme